MASPQSGFLSTDSRSDLEMLVFVEGGKLENPEKNPQSKDENQRCFNCFSQLLLKEMCGNQQGEFV